MDVKGYYRTVSVDTPKDLELVRTIISGKNDYEK